MIQPGPGATGATGATGGKNSMSLGSPPALTPDQTSQIAQQAGPFTSQIAQQPTTPGVSSAATTGLPDWMKQGQQQWQQQQTQLQQLQQQIQQAQSALGQSGQSGQSVTSPQSLFNQYSQTVSGQPNPGSAYTPNFTT